MKLEKMKLREQRVLWLVNSFACVSPLKYKVIRCKQKKIMKNRNTSVKEKENHPRLCLTISTTGGMN